MNSSAWARAAARRPALAGDLRGQLIDLPGGLLDQGGEEPVRVAERRVLL